MSQWEHKKLKNSLKKWLFIVRTSSLSKTNTKKVLGWFYKQHLIKGTRCKVIMDQKRGKHIINLFLTMKNIVYAHDIKEFFS